MIYQLFWVPLLENHISFHLCMMQQGDADWTLLPARLYLTDPEHGLWWSFKFLKYLSTMCICKWHVIYFVFPPKTVRYRHKSCNDSATLVWFCLTSSSVTWMVGQTAPSASFLMIQSWEEWWHTRKLCCLSVRLGQAGELGKEELDEVQQELV